MIRYVQPGQCSQPIERLVVECFEQSRVIMREVEHFKLIQALKSIGLYLLQVVRVQIQVLGVLELHKSVSVDGREALIEQIYKFEAVQLIEVNVYYCVLQVVLLYLSWQVPQLEELVRQLHCFT